MDRERTLELSCSLAGQRAQMFSLESAGASLPSAPITTGAAAFLSRIFLSPLVFLELLMLLRLLSLGDH